MNKAFVKDPEPQDPRCPKGIGCDAIGVSVSLDTVMIQAGEFAAGLKDSSVFYCPSPHCEVAYFTAWGQTILAKNLASLWYPKNLEAPVCPCFSVTALQIIEEAETGRKAIIQSLVKRSESFEAQCASKSPTGKSCVTEARRLFMKHYRN